jgi:hypothetical protein
MEICLNQQPHECNAGALTTALECEQEAMYTCDMIQIETSDKLPLSCIFNECGKSKDEEQKP